MKRIFWCAILFFFALGCYERSFAQERRFSDSEILEQMRREGVDKILPILGSREISVKRHFENYKYPIRRNKNWDVVHSKAIIVGVGVHSRKVGEIKQPAQASPVFGRLAYPDKAVL